MYSTTVWLGLIEGAVGIVIVAPMVWWLGRRQAGQIQGARPSPGWVSLGIVGLGLMVWFATTTVAFGPAGSGKWIILVVVASTFAMCCFIVSIVQGVHHNR